MERMSGLSRYRRNDDFVSRNIVGETVLVPIRQRLGDLESIYTLNNVATCIWERLATPASLDEIVGVIEEQFEGNRDVIRRDAEEFLQTLLTLGAIRPVEIPESTVRE
ncbi:MAG TPA: PqqD family protein [Candidatus Methylomirabilis sp.]